MVTMALPGLTTSPSRAAQMPTLPEMGAVIRV